MAKTSEMDLRDYGRILVRRKWWVLGSVVCGAAFAMMLNTITDPVYRATVRIQISREPSRSLLTGEMLESPTAQSDNLALYTAAELITNRKLLARVVGTLREQGVLAGNEKPGAPWYKTLFGRRTAPAAVAQMGGATDTGDPLARAVPQSQVDWLLTHISVEPVRDTRLVNIHVEHSKPRSAEQIANTVADMFVQYQVDQRSAGSSNLVTYLTSQIQEVRQSLQAAEKASAHVKASGDRAGAAERYARLRDAAASQNIDLERLPARSAALDALKKQLLDSETELAKARGIYKDRHPRLVMLESENESIRANIRRELEDAAAAARAELNAADARAQSRAAGRSKRQPQPRHARERSDESARAVQRAAHEVEGSGDHRAGARTAGRSHRTRRCQLEPRASAQAAQLHRLPVRRPHDRHRARLPPRIPAPDDPDSAGCRRLPPVARHGPDSEGVTPWIPPHTSL